MTIKNGTLNKLTNKEAQDLGLANNGYHFYRGDLKARKRGWIRENDTDGITVYFHNQYGATFEFIKLASQSIGYTGKMMQDWAMRVYDREAKEYIHYGNLMAGVEFFK